MMSELHNIRKILMIRPTFRIGNTLIDARLIPSVQLRFPNARIDFLGADTTVSLLDNMGLQKIEAVSRSHGYRWYSFFCMIRRLRKENYDLTIDCGRGSTTSALLTALVGSRYRVGKDCAWGRGVLNVRLSIDRQPHVYDNLVAFAHKLQGGLGDRPMAIPYYRASVPEMQSAKDWLYHNGLGDLKDPLPFVGVFVGGHLDKCYPDLFWLSVLSQLDDKCVPVLVFSGPEEFALLDKIRKLRLHRIFIAPVQNLRSSAALFAHARLVVSPDTGFLHLAAALNLPAISILKTERSSAYAPNGVRDRRLWKPSVTEVLLALTTHPDWMNIPI